MYIRQKRGKRHSKGMQIADNPLSRNFARIFAEREGGVMLTREDGLPLVRDNEEFQAKLKEIRDKILAKYDLSNEKGKPFSSMTVLSWIRPHPKNRKFPLRDPGLEYLTMFCEAIGKEPWEMYLEPGQIHLNKLPLETQFLFQRILNVSGNQEILAGIKAILDIHENMIRKYGQRIERMEINSEENHEEKHSNNNV